MMTTHKEISKDKRGNVRGLFQSVSKFELKTRGKLQTV